MREEHVPGTASGCSVNFNKLTGRWGWSAYGPRGGSMGETVSEARAWELARAAQRAVEPRRPTRIV